MAVVAQAEYARLLDFEVVTRIFYSELASDRRLGLLHRCETIIRQHGLEDVVGIELAHKHFDLPDGTLLVERQNVAGPSATMKPEPAAAGGSSGSLTPFAFFYAGGGWIPHEYVADCPLAEQRLALVQAKPGFLEELGATLAEEPGDVTRFLGFVVLHRDFLESDVGTIETAGDEPHELKLQPYTEEIKAKISESGTKSEVVAWSWTSNGPKTHACIICCHHQSCIAHR
jgi:hypothetical protein